MYDDSEPLEVCDGILSDLNPKHNPNETLIILFDLYKHRFLQFRQTPLKPLGQDFSMKDIQPNSPEEIIGDLEPKFKEYCEKRAYLSTFGTNKKDQPIGIPFGIYVSLTQAGREEVDKPGYKIYRKT